MLLTMREMLLVSKYINEMPMTEQERKEVLEIEKTSVEFYGKHILPEGKRGDEQNE